MISLPLVAVQHVGEQFGGGRRTDALAISQLVQSTSQRQHTLPVGTVGRTAGHRTDQVLVNRNDLANGAAGDELATGRSRIDGHTDAVLVAERQRGGALLVLDAHLSAGLVEQHLTIGHLVDQRDRQTGRRQVLDVLELIGDQLIVRSLHRAERRVERHLENLL